MRSIPARWLLASLLLLGAPLARAATIDLYSATVTTVRGDAGRAQMFAAAIRDVLVRVTGSRAAPGDPGFAALLSDPGRHVTTFRAAGAGYTKVSFNGAVIEQAVAAARQPFWGAERPATLVWLALDRAGQRSLVTGAADSPERRAVEAAANQRGLPIVWPTGQTADDIRVRLDDVLSGRAGPLLQAAGRYGADGVLVGRPAGAGGAISWTWYGPASGETVRGAAGDGVHLVADRYAARFASAAAAQRTQVLVTVGGIDGLEAYAAVTRALEGLSVVRGVTLLEVLPDAAAFSVSVLGDAAVLQRAATLDGRFGAAAPAVAGATTLGLQFNQ